MNKRKKNFWKCFKMTSGNVKNKITTSCHEKKITFGSRKKITSGDVKNKITTSCHEKNHFGKLINK